MHNEAAINDKGAWVVYRLRSNYGWLLESRPDLRKDLDSEFDLARLLAEMYDDARKAYNESKRRIHALAKQEGYVWTGAKWHGCRRVDVFADASATRRRLAALEASE